MNGVVVPMLFLLREAGLLTWNLRRPQTASAILPDPMLLLFGHVVWDPLTEMLKALWGWLVPLACGAVFGWLFRVVGSRRPSRLLLDFKEPKSLNIVIGSAVTIIPHSSDVHSTAGVPFFGFGPIFAFHHVTQLLTRAYPFIKRYEVTTSRTFDKNNLRNDLILLGWPGGNEITGLVVKDLQLPIAWHGHDLVDSTTRKVLFTAKIDKGHVTEDFGVIIRARNPYARKSVVMIFAGGESYGVYAAADYLWTNNLAKIRGIPLLKNGVAVSVLDFAIPKRFKMEYYVIVLKIKVRGHVISEPAMVARYKLRG